MFCLLVVYYFCFFIKLVGLLFYMFKFKDYVKKWFVSGGLKVGNCRNVIREVFRFFCFIFVLFEEFELFFFFKFGFLGIEREKNYIIFLCNEIG